MYHVDQLLESHWLSTSDRISKYIESFRWSGFQPTWNPEITTDFFRRQINLG